jgi:STAS domain-containing protein
LTRRSATGTLRAEDELLGVFRIVDPPEPPEVELVERTFWIGPEPVTGAIVLRGDLDLGAVKAFERALRPAIEHGGPVTMDASELGFMDSTGVRLLIHTAQRHVIPHKRPLPDPPDA